MKWLIAIPFGVANGLVWAFFLAKGVAMLGDKSLRYDATMAGIERQPLRSLRPSRGRWDRM